MDANALRAWRRAQRSALLDARARLAPDERRTASAAIEAHLAQLFAGRRDGIVAAYWPIHGEFDVLPFIARLRAQGVTPALPVVLGKDRPLEFRVWHEDRPLAHGVYGIGYPAEGPAVHPGALIVPLLGFDGAGSRLGHGAGFYDRTLAALQPKPFVVGAGFECGRLPTIHPQPHDVPMDAIVTEAGVFRSAR